MYSLQKMLQGKESVSELGRAMAEAVSCRPLAAETRVRSQVNSVSGRRSVIGRGCRSSTWVFGCNYLYLDVPYSFVYRNSIWPS
jgi:phosphatidylserine decarboxylase